MMDALTEKKARLIMELRSQGIRNTATLNAIESVPREAFLPQALLKHAYDNVSLPLSHGQTISQPFVVAFMTDALELDGKQRVLEIGTGSGYQAAVLCALARRVYSIETLRPLLVEAERRLAAMRVTNITCRLGDGGQGWPEAAPFDRIIMTCATSRVPATLMEQLKPGGIMIAPIGETDQTQTLRLFRKAAGATATVTEEDLLPVRFVPLVRNAN